jgi:quinol monooxygenase YgiN
MTEPGVIVRVLRAHIRPGRVAAFNVVFRRQVALLREQPGILYVKLARRLEPDGGQEAVLFEEWADAASLYAWVGPNLAAPRLVPGARELIDSLAVSHFEVLADDGITHGLSANFDRPTSGADEADADETGSGGVGAA